MLLVRRRAIPPSAFRIGVALVATGDPRIFQTAEAFLHTPGGITLALSHNGRLLDQGIVANQPPGDFIVSDSGGGFDTVTLLSFTPNARSVLRATYYAA
jgi:hypothetical protein